MCLKRVITHSTGRDDSCKWICIITTSPTSHWWFAWPFTTVWSTLWGRSVWSKMLTRSRNSDRVLCSQSKEERRKAECSINIFWLFRLGSGDRCSRCTATAMKTAKTLSTTKPQSSVYTSSRVPWPWVQQMLEGSLMYFSETGETVGSTKCLSAPGQADMTCFTYVDRSRSLTNKFHFAQKNNYFTKKRKKNVNLHIRITLDVRAKYGWSRSCSDK